MGKTSDKFLELIPDFNELNGLSPSEFVKLCWDRFLNNQKKDTPNNSLNGNFFELILTKTFMKHGIFPYFREVEFSYIPDIKYDFIFSCEDNNNSEPSIICVSAKVSCRERYKQADLEAFHLKNVHRKSKCYLVILDSNDALKIETKIKNRDVFAIDKVILATESSFDDLIKELSIKLSQPKDVPVFKKSKKIEPNI